METKSGFEHVVLEPENSGGFQKMIDDASNPLQCFGDLEKVFPMGEDGFRMSPPECMKCPMVKPCIQAAMRGAEGLKEEEKRVDRAYRCGLIGTFERWSKKKLIQKKIEDKERQERDRCKKTP